MLPPRRLSLTLSSWVARGMTTYFKASALCSSVSLLQAMCLYRRVARKQQGPFPVPGAARCHVNMAGYSPSSCIFCRFNEWGKFCHADPGPGRYCTCVRCVFMDCARAGPRGPVCRGFCSFKGLLHCLGWDEHTENVLPDRTAAGWGWGASGHGM